MMVLVLTEARVRWQVYGGVGERGYLPFKIRRPWVSHKFRRYRPRPVGRLEGWVVG
jgi:hypothetical protein